LPPNRLDIVTVSQYSTYRKSNSEEDEGINGKNTNKLKYQCCAEQHKACHDKLLPNRKRKRREITKAVQTDKEEAIHQA